MADGDQVADAELQKIRDGLKDAQDKFEQRTAQVEQQLTTLRNANSQAALSAQAQPAAQPAYPSDGTGYGYAEPDAAAYQQEQQRRAQWEARHDEDLAVVKFKQDNTDAAEYMDEIMARIGVGNPDRAQYVIMGANGQVDAYQTLRTTKMAIENERLRAAQAKAEDLVKDQQPKRDADKAKATISGDSSVATSQEIDVSKLKDPADFIKYGLVEEDPNDPLPDHLRPKP